MHSKVTILGHPVHPMLVAYPIAFNTATLVGFVIYGISADLFWLKLTIALNVAAVVMAVVAAVPGFIDWAAGHPERNPGQTHRADPHGAQRGRVGAVYHQLLRLLPVLERSR
jgi:uncharacterized membrane protein